MVVGEKGKKVLVNDEGEFDPSEIPKRSWQDYEGDKWNARDENPFADGKVQRDMDTMSLAPTVQMLNDPTNPFRDSVSEAASVLTDNIHLAPEKSQVVTDQDLTNAIRDILAKSDLSQITKRSVRRELEQMYGFNLSSRKEYISWAIEAILSREI